MKVKELIEQLQICNPDAEVGFECLKITYVVQETDDYVDLGGNGQGILE